MRSTLVTTALCLVFSWNTAAASDPPAPAALWRAIESSRLEPDKAVAVKSLRLNAGLAALEIEEGTIFPATPVGDRVAEMVFVGEARLVLEPPDDIEAAQLELFTGSPRLDETISEAVLVMAIDAAVDAVFERSPAEPDGDAKSTAREIFDRWRQRPERRYLGVDTGILRDAAGDPVYAGYFAGWFRGEELGEFLYLFEPDSREQVTLGKFTPLDATEKEKRKLARDLYKAQRKGRLIGLSVEDLGQWDTWVAASTSDADGEPLPGASPFEPELYEIDLALEEPDLELRGRARLHLRGFGKSPVVTLTIHSDLTIDQVREDGRAVFWKQTAGEVVVVLPAAPEPDSRFVLEVDYSGRLIDKDAKSYALRDTILWHPHTGTIDRAAYDVTFRWPEKLDLVTGGRRVDGGVEDGRRFERRRLDQPTFGFSFEVGRFKTLIGQAGHVQVSLAFDATAQSYFPKESREDLLQTLTDALTYFEDSFGPYPFDELNAVTVDRSYSQSFLGFITLASLNMTEADFFSILLGLEDRRTVLAHEVAHQWWGHMVAWQSYRDQWISEAMANYSAVLFARHVLKDERVVIGPTTGWQAALTATTADGRAIESVGPLVLGERLVSSVGGDAYQAIVYKKGAVVLDMLARRFREDVFLKILHSLVKAVDFRPISTEDFVRLIERITEVELDDFAQQFIYGTGLPEVYYDYDFERAGDKWVVNGEAHQESPWRYRHRVVELDDGTLDVASERFDQIEVTSSSLVVPIEITVYNPQATNTRALKKAKIDPQVAGNATVKGRMLLQGKSNPIRIELDYEPKELWLDKDKEVFGRFFNERRHPKRMLYYQGLDAAAAGDYDEAERLYSAALAAEPFSGPAYTPAERDDHKAEGRSLDCLIQLQLARRYLDQGRGDDARAAFEETKRLVTSDIRSWMRSRLKRLEARLAIREGDYDRAYKLLRKTHRGGTGSTEGLLLFAIAAGETGHPEERATALAAAEEKGADVSALAPPAG